jgi:glutamate--cysteine ligase
VKSYIELRGADSGPSARLCALPAFWAGLLYDTSALDAAWDLVKAWTAADRKALYDAVPRQGLKAVVRGRTAQDVARDVLDLAYAGLRRRARRDGAGNDETGFLASLQEIAASGITPAERMLAAYRSEWRGDMAKVYEHCSF